MPSLMNVHEFVCETRDDVSSPTTSSFVSRMSQCRQTVATLEESLDFDRDGLTKMKKAVKAIYNGGNAHTDNEVYLSKALERLGANAMTKDQEPDIGAAFIKFSIVTKELSALMKTLMQNLNNIIMFPLDNILKGDLKGVKGDLKKPFDKAWREYDAKISKIEKEKKQQAKDAGLIRTEISAAEIADEMDKERKIFQLQMCEYMIKVNEIKSKKGTELLQHLVEYYNAQTNYFRDGLNSIEQFNGYVNDLATKLQIIRTKQEDERRNLVDLRTMLKSSSPFLDNTYKDMSSSNNVSNDKRDGSAVSGYSLHQLQGNKNYGYSKAGHLLKKSEGKMRVKVWQKRKCEVKDGFLYIYHSDESKPPTKVNLLTCQIKAVHDEKKSFDLICYNRTYHFQTEDESEMESWIYVLINCKEGALKKEFDSNAQNAGPNCEHTNQSLRELQQSIINHIQKLQGNDKCVDCNSTKDPTWLSTNFGVLTCIECSGIHREMGVHVSRIQSLTLDNIGTSQLLLARVMSNAGFNDIMEATLTPSKKPTPLSSMEMRNEFIRAKYIEKKFAIRTCNGDENDLKADLENGVLSRNLLQILQSFAEGADLSWTLPDSTNDETGLHYAIAQEDGTSLFIADFLVQNGSTLDKVTKDGQTALHYSVIYNQSECMKLLLRSGANINAKNYNRKTPLDLAKEKGNSSLIDLLECAAQNKKMPFENVNIDWGIHPEDPSTDISDDDIMDEKYRKRQMQLNRHHFGSNLMSGSEALCRMRKLSLPSLEHNLYNYSYDHLHLPHVTPSQIVHADRTQRSRPSSVVGSESPSSKSSDASYRQKQSRKIAGAIAALQAHGSIKKRSAPAPPKDDDSSSSHSSTVSKNHSRTASDSDKNASLYGTVQRPKCPPPPAPESNRLSNGQSVESLPSLSSEYDDYALRSINAPVPPPRKRHDGKLRRCQALYDCEADREDELAFKEGEIITVLNEITDDDEWMEGFIDGNGERRGVFPVSFVQFLKD